MYRHSNFFHLYESIQIKKTGKPVFFILDALNHGKMLVDILQALL